MTGFLRKEHLNGPNEISCTAYKYVDGERSPLWDKITDFKVIYIPEYQEKYEIHISGAEENETTKSITGTALAEAELSQLLLEHLEINTENDMARTSTVPGAGYDENFPTLFYRDPDKIHDYGAVWNSSDKYQNYSPEDKREVLRTSSLLHRLLEKAPNYHIGHIDDTLQSLNLVLSFGISNTYLYDELVGEISEEYGVLFIFDSIAKTVSAYDLMNTCDGCGYRGDFENVCPKCGSVSCHGQYGEDTTIFVSGKNLAESITKDSDPDSVKTCFRIEGGDDIITAAISNINPNGTNRIFSIPPELMNDMPIDLAEKINSYNKICDEYDSTYPFHLNLDDYNDCVGYLKDYYPDAEYPTFSSLLIGYSQTTNLLYNLIDMESVLKTSMMPTAKYDNPSITETMKIISNMKDIAVRYPAASTTTYVNNAVLDMVKASINTALYKAEIYENNGYPQYTQNTTGTWRGYIKLTSLEVEEGEIAESQTSDLLTFPITDNVELYIKQKIQKNMAKVEINDIMDLTNVGDNSMTIEDFRNRLHYYSADYLDNLKTEFEACLSIMYEMQGVADSQTYSRFIDVYNKRINAIVTEKNRRDGQLEKLYRLYYLNQTDFTESGELIDARNNVKNALNFEKYLGDLWPVFCSYLREDTYQNSNYISTGLNNQGIIERARELWDTAKRELEKSSHNQYTINTTLDNLLQIPEFGPLTENFRTGNWIHVAFDDEVYRLRLLSYQINFDELQTIDVEFSTAVNYGGSFSDVKNVIDSARTISGSYNAVANQVQKTSDAAKYVHGWVKDGLNATMTKYVNDPFTQDIVIDKNGILCRAYDELKEEYDLCQIRILRNGMYLTNDGWENVYAGIGKISYYDPIAKKQKDDYGIIAKTIVGRLVLGEFLGFTNADGTMRFDEGGLTVENSKSAVYINPGSSKVFSIKKKSSSGNTDVMYIDASGNGYFNGTVNATSGTFRGTVYASAGEFTGKVTATSGSFTGAVNATSGTFRGTVYASAGEFTGKVTATSGTIGGWEIGNYSMSYGNTGGNSFILLDALNKSIISREGANKAVFTSGYLGFEKDNKKYLRVHPTYWASKPEVYGVALNSEADSKFISFGNKKTENDSSYTTNLVINYGLNPDGITQDIIMFGDSYFGAKLYFTGNDNYLNYLVNDQNNPIGIYCNKSFYVNNDLTVNGCVKGKLKFGNGNTSLWYTAENHLYCTGKFGVNGTPYVGYALSVNGKTYCTDEIFCNAAIRFDEGKGIYNDVTGNYMLRYNDSYTCVGNGSANTGIWSEDNNLHLRTTSTIFTKSGASDIRIKKDIHKINTIYEDFFMSIVPYSFRYMIDGDNSTHIGYIAQDVADSAKTYGLPEDNNLWEETEPQGDALQYIDPEDKLLRINYLEWIPLNTFMIQRVYKKAAIQEEEITRLKKQLQTLMNERGL